MTEAGARVVNVLESLTAKGERPNVELLSNSPELRLVRFDLAPGVEVKGHRADAVVALYALAGGGRVTAGGRESSFRAGDLAVCQRNEIHGFTAGAEGLAVLAAIAPSPE